MTSYSSRLPYAPQSAAAGTNSTRAVAKGGDNNAAAMQKAFIDSILQQRMQEREIRQTNRSRLDRFQAVAQEAHRSSSAGVTEIMLRMKKERHQVELGSGSGGGDEHGSGGTESRPSLSRTGSQGGCTTTTAARDETTLSSARTRCDVAASEETRLPNPTTRTERLHGADSARNRSGTKSSVGRANLHDEEEEDENGGHVCVVRTNVTELLFSSTTTAPNAPQIAAVTRQERSRAGPHSSGKRVGEEDRGSSSSIATTPVVSGSSSNARRQQQWQNRCAGPIPLSLRGLVGARRPSTSSSSSSDNAVAAGTTTTTEQGPAPSRQIHSAPPGDVPPSAAAPQPPQPPPQPLLTTTAAADVPPPQKKTLPRKPSSGGTVKSILKRHPIPRRHGRKVHFAEEHLAMSAHSSSSLLRLSKDGPPVPLVSLFSDDREVGNEGVDVKAAVEDVGGKQNEAGDGWWGADSETFNREWGLPSPNSNCPSASTSATTAAASPAPSCSAVKALHGRRQPEQLQPERSAFLRRSFHTGLSMEEAKLMHAIVAVNERLKRVGYSKFLCSAGQPNGDGSDTCAQREAEQTAGGSSAPRAPETLRDANAAPQQTSAAAVLQAPRFVVVTRNGGVVVPRSTSAPPAAVTSRSAPTPTPLAPDCRRVVVVSTEPGDGCSAPLEHIAAALPKRLPDHHGLVRRDRFGKRMSVIPR